MFEVQLSIIIPVYNVEKFLDSCLHSVANQTIENIEVIIVNDGSTDNSLNIAQSYTEKYSHFKIFTQENQGLSGARNTGLENARGNYITFLDSDDFVDHNMYRRLLEVAINNNSDMVKCASIVFDDVSKKVIRIKDDFQSSLIIRQVGKKFEEYLKRNFDISVWSGIYHRSLFETIRFPKGVCYEDHYVTPKLLSLADTLTYIPETLVYYRRRPGAITTTFSPTKRIQKLASLNSLYNVLCKEGLHKSLSKEFTDYFFYTLINYHDSMIYNSPELLTKKTHSFVNIIDDEIVDFINEMDHLNQQRKLLFKCIHTSHFLYFLTQKTSRVLEITGLKQPLKKKVSSSPKKDPSITSNHLDYIEIYA